MRLTAGGFRELHWHTASEWAIMLYGSARLTAIDLDGQKFVIILSLDVFDRVKAEGFAPDVPKIRAHWISLSWAR
jgi:oxalate decarboxylase/phosphoglucose isomerase-like protein (cupin superfamily)